MYIIQKNGLAVSKSKVVLFQTKILRLSDFLSPKERKKNKMPKKAIVASSRGKGLRLALPGPIKQYQSGHLPNNPSKSYLPNNHNHNIPNKQNKPRLIVPSQSKPSWPYKIKVSQKSTKNLGPKFEVNQMKKLI
ncbi:hypothetical protein PIB30_061444 [Stylosanthes scabra]|uniref:Uncharacterized protein n=1 Tax=Stylosanthes scabra TaxID=79078 RepID=A0ABU6RL61_9FABA|nr:hypothetical protein [Stylosanthes scabra]